MSAQSSRLSLEESGPRQLVAAGVIDTHTTDSLLDRLESLGTGDDVHLDLDGVEFIDSSGLRTIVTVHQQLSEADRRLVLTRVSSAVERLLEITGLRDHLHLE